MLTGTIEGWQGEGNYMLFVFHWFKYAATMTTYQSSNTTNNIEALFRDF